MSWTYTHTPGRDLADPGWATTPTSCRDAMSGGQLYAGADLVEIDSLLGSGYSASSSGWLKPILESCRDGE